MKAVKNRRMLLAAATLLWSLAGCSQNKDAEAPAAKPSASSGAPMTGSAGSAGPGGSTGAAAQPAVATGKPVGTLKVGGKAVCAVCAVKEGTKNEEDVKATIDYKGKTYGFCSLDEKAEFISDPAKYADK